jgi:hypothetical protein
VVSGARFDQLSGNPHTLAGFAHRAFEHIAHTQFARYLLHVDGLALVGKARIAGDHEQPGQPGNSGRDFFDHAVSEIFLLRIATHVLERQHRQRRLVG